MTEGMFMPHITVKLYPGRSEDQKMRLAEAITQNVMEIAQSEEKSVSVSFEEVEPADWPEKVYRPDIMENEAWLYKKPGYNPFEGGDPRSLREAYLEKLESQFEEWKPEIDRLKSKAEKAALDARQEYYKLIEDLQARQKSARAKLEELRQTSGSAWEGVKTGSEGAWKGMEKALKAVVAKIKKPKHIPVDADEARRLRKAYDQELSDHLEERQIEINRLKIKAKKGSTDLRMENSKLIDDLEEKQKINQMELEEFRGLRRCLGDL